MCQSWESLSGYSIAYLWALPGHPGMCLEWGLEINLNLFRLGHPLLLKPNCLPNACVCLNVCQQFPSWLPYVSGFQKVQFSSFWSPFPLGKSKAFWNHFPPHLNLHWLLTLEYWLKLLSLWDKDDCLSYYRWWNWGLRKARSKKNVTVDP